MRVIRITLIITVSAVLMSSLASGVAAAPPGLPTVFYGTVKTSYGQIPPGSLVRAFIEGSEFCQADIQQDPLLGSVYVIQVLADDPDTQEVEGGRSGDLISFAVELPGDGSYTMIQTCTWESGAAIELNLSSECVLTLPLIVVAG